MPRKALETRDKTETFNTKEIEEKGKSKVLK